MDESVIWALKNVHDYHEVSQTVVDGEIVKMVLENEDQQQIILSHKMHGLSH